MNNRIDINLRDAASINRDINPGSVTAAIDLLRGEIDLLEKEIETLAIQVAPISVDRPAKAMPESEEKQGLSSACANDVRVLAFTVRKLRGVLVGIITQIDL